MYIIKCITSIWAFVYSCANFAQAQHTSVDSSFTDDLFALIVYSGLVAGGIILNIKGDIFNYAKAVLSLWFPTSAIFHWLTINEWTKWNFYFSMLFIVASALFSFTQFTDCFKRKLLSVGHYIYLPVVVVFVMTALNLCYNDNVPSSMCMAMYSFVMLSQVVDHWFLRKNTTTASEEEYISIWPSYSSTFFKTLCLILLASVLYSASSFIVNINMLTKLTRPSAFYYVTDTLMPMPGLIWLTLCCFGSHGVSHKIKNALLFIQSALVAIRVFFDLRPEYLDFVFTEPDRQIGILALIFFSAVYCYYAFHTKRVLPVLAGIAYILLTCSGFISERYPFDEMSVAMLICVFSFVCTIIDDYIADRKFEREMDILLNHIRSTWKTVSDDELDFADED